MPWLFTNLFELTQGKKSVIVARRSRITVLPISGGAPRPPCYIMANIFREAKVESETSWCDWILLEKQLVDHIHTKTIFAGAFGSRNPADSLLAISEQSSAGCQITNTRIHSLPLTVLRLTDLNQSNW